MRQGLLDDHGAMAMRDQGLVSLNGGDPLARVVLYTGDLEVQDPEADRSWSGHGEIWFDLQPTPAVRCQIGGKEFPTSSPFDIPTHVLVKLVGEASSPLETRETVPGLQPGERWSSSPVSVVGVSGVASEGESLIWVDVDIVNLRLTLPNLVLGRRFLMSQPGEWSVAMWDMSQNSDWLMSVENARGYARTHRARFQRVDGAPFSAEAYERFAATFGRALAFAQGGYAGLVLPTGVDRSGDVAWRRWTGSKSAPWSAADTWCDERACLLAFGEIVQGFVDLEGRNPVWEPTLQRTMSMLSDARLQNGPHLDSRVLLAVAAVELVAWAIDTEQGLHAGYADLDLHKRIRHALQWAGIPVALPAHYNAIRTYVVGRSGPSTPDVAHALASARNAIVHAPKPQQGAAWPGSDALIEAWYLACWCADLLVLRLSGYQGDYANVTRAGPRWKGEVEPVPWTKGGGGVREPRRPE